MAKPRIIIADTDYSYIIPLQLKFVEEFFDKVELVILTEREYFEKTFSSPQSAEILIVSEELYDTSIQKHNINHIFLMTEQYEEETTAELNLNKIFKYTSIKEIFNEITGKSAVDLNIASEVQKECQIVLVYSAAGGTGKTTVALGISTCLTKSYKRVLYINAEHLQSFQHVFENKSCISASDVYENLSNANNQIYADIKHVIRKELFSYIPAFKSSLMSLGLPYSVFEIIALSAKKAHEYDYIIIDSDTTFDEDKAKLINIADKVIFVTNQTNGAVYATNTLVSNINGTDSEKYIFVCNNLKKNEENALISPNIKMKFTVSDYIEHLQHYDCMSYEEIAKKGDFQRITFNLI